MTTTQSVVVPVEPTEEMMACAEQASQMLEWQIKASWSAMLAAAPDPSSLAGGESLTRNTINTVFDELRSEDDERYGSIVNGTLRDARNAILAALSPEAPAREPMLQVIPDTSVEGCYRLEAVPQAEVDAMVAAGKRVIAEALTPRHEAPADPCASHRSMGFHIDPCCPHREAPAEGAGEDGAFWFDPRDPEVTDTNPDNILIHYYAPFDVTMIQCGDMAMFGFWFTPADGSEFQFRYFNDRDQADAEALAQEAALRARSSAPEAIKAAYQRGWNDREDDIIERAERIAPEAREGEAVAWRWRHPHFYNNAWQPGRMHDGAGGECQPLYTHPAAPSADKLRIAVEALEWVEVNASKTDCMAVTHKAIQALAALKAEGC